MDLFFRVEEPFGDISGLNFGFETIVTNHHHDQAVRGHPTAMAYENQEKVEEFFKKLELKLHGSRSLERAYEYWEKTGTCRSRDI